MVVWCIFNIFVEIKLIFEQKEKGKKKNPQTQTNTYTKSILKKK